MTVWQLAGFYSTDFDREGGVVVGVFAKALQDVHHISAVSNGVVEASRNPLQIVGTFQIREKNDSVRVMSSIDDISRRHTFWTRELVKKSATDLWGGVIGPDRWSIQSFTPVLATLMFHRLLYQHRTLLGGKIQQLADFNWSRSALFNCPVLTKSQIFYLILK